MYRLPASFVCDALKIGTKPIDRHHRIRKVNAMSIVFLSDGRMRKNEGAAAVGADEDGGGVGEDSGRMRDIQTSPNTEEGG